MTLLVKVKGRGPRSIATIEPEHFTCSYTAILRQRSSIGGIPVMEGSGRYNKTHVQFALNEALRGDGLKGVYPARGEFPVADVKKHLRRLREEEAEQIAEFDSDIESLIDELNELRKQRDELVRQAWSKAHVVTQKEIREIADKRLREIQERKAASSG